MLFIRLAARRKRKPIYDKFYQNMAKCFFLFSKWTKWNTIICEMSTNMGIFRSNRSFCNFYPNLSTTSFIYKTSKNRSRTWNDHLINTWNGNHPFCNFTQINPNLFFNFKMSKAEISKMSKIKIHIWKNHPWNFVNWCFCSLNAVWSKRKF